MGTKRTALTGLAAIAVGVTGTVAVTLAPPAGASPTDPGTYNLLPVQRIVDTTAGVGARRAALAAGATLRVAATGGLGDRSISALDLTVTAIRPTRNGYLTVYSGAPRPAVATLTFTAGESTPNNAAVVPAADGSVLIHNGSPGAVQVALDRNGYWTGGEIPAGGAAANGVYHPVTPVRVADSRRAGGAQLGWSKHTSVPLAGAAALPAALPDDTVAALVNVGVAAPSGNGYLVAYGGDLTQPGALAPGTNSLSFDAGHSRSNQIVVQLNSDGSLELFNGARVPVDYVVDLVGYYTSANRTSNASGATLTRPTGYRVYDTRQRRTNLGAKGATIVQVVPNEKPADTVAVIVQITATGATTSGYITAWNGTTPRPLSSVTNYSPRLSRTGTLTVPIDERGFITLYNGGNAPVGVTVDVTCYIKPARADVGR